MLENKGKKSQKKMPIKIIGASVIVSVLFVWAIYPYIISFLNCYLVTSEKIPKLDLMTFGSSFGTFGDSFGALNTLFSGLAFAGIIISIFLQSEELTETRKEITAQKEEFEKQTTVFNKQTFENTFFQMLNAHNEIIKSVTDQIELTKPHPSVVGVVIPEHQDISGRAAFKMLCEKSQLGIDIRTADSIDKVDHRYMRFHKEYGHLVGHYFGNVYQILKYVDQSKVENKTFYTNILRAQFSRYELELLFFSCLSELGRKKFKPLLEKYAFFEHFYIPENYIANRTLRLYAIQAYGSNDNLEKMYEDDS